MKVARSVWYIYNIFFSFSPLIVCSNNSQFFCSLYLIPFFFAFVNMAEGNPLRSNSINPSSIKRIKEGKTSRFPTICRRWFFFLFNTFVILSSLFNEIINQMRKPLPAAMVILFSSSSNRRTISLWLNHRNSANYGMWTV